MKGRRLLALLVVVMAVLLLGLCACGDTEQTPPQKLSAPTVTLNGDVASWEANDKADKFEISIDGSLSYLENTVTQKTLTDGQSFKIRAVGNGTTYSTSDWSNTVTYEAGTTPPSPTEPTKLQAPVVSISQAGLATWSVVPNAVSYTYKINGGTEISTSTTAVQLTNGQSIVVKAVGNGTDYLDSDYSASQTYEETTTPPAPTDPTKLQAPIVSISQTGLATWSVVPNAVSYTYKINGGTEISTSTTAVQLTNGQSIVVKAVGNGTDYLDSDYSASQTYTESTENPNPNPNPTPSEAPTYLGIVASNQEPTPENSSSGVLAMAYRTSLTFEESLRAFLGKSENALGDSEPIASDYEVYSRGEQVVYIQIWLDNPDQNTILSLKLNGVKYQAGGALQSFFVQDDDTYLNCVYVAVTIPQNAYEEISYQVTEIEYVEGTNVSQDGKAVLIDEENDTVTIGLTYEETLIASEMITADRTASSLSFSLTIEDDSIVPKIGGWLRVIIFNQQNEILGQHKLTKGENTFTFDNLSADTYYSVMAFMLGDAHDGQGVTVHTITWKYLSTDSAVDVIMASDIAYDDQQGKYVPAIEVDTTVNDPTFTLTKVELYDWDSEELVYSSEYDGEIVITEGLLANHSYNARVYYKNASNKEQYYQSYISTIGLDSPWVKQEMSYGMLNHAILGFDFGNGKYNVSNVKIQIWDEDSKQYIAQDALYLLENPTAIADLEALMETLDMRSEEYYEAYKRCNKLREAQQKIDENYSDLTIQDWEALASQGIYIYEYVLGQDDEFFKGANNYYYVVLRDYHKLHLDNSWQYKLTADVDFCNGNEPENNQLCSGYFEISPAIGEGDFLFPDNDEDYNDIFTIDENNVVYLELMSRTGGGYESYAKIGYVNQFVLVKDYEIVKVLWSKTEESAQINEEEWLQNVKTALINGSEPESAFPFGELEPITFDLDDVDLSDMAPGNYGITFTYVMYGETYDEEHKFDRYGNPIEYKIKGKLPLASININTSSIYDYGNIEIVIPESLNYGNWSSYLVEIKNQDGQLAGTYDRDSLWGVKLTANQSIRIKLTANDYIDYYTDGDWSEWFVCTPGKLQAPEITEKSYNSEGMAICWNWVEGAEKFIYVLNGGEETEVYDTSLGGLKNGDTIKIKAVASGDVDFDDSDYTEITLVDERTPLGAPVVTFNQDSMCLEWQAVANASYYRIYNADTGEHLTEVYDTYYSAPIGSNYKVRALTDDYQAYSPSDYSAPVFCGVKLDPPEITISAEGAVTFTSYDLGTRVYYTYVINDGEEMRSTKADPGITLEKGDTIKVKMMSGIYASDWSEAKQY